LVFIYFFRHYYWKENIVASSSLIDGFIQAILNDACTPREEKLLRHGRQRFEEELSVVKEMLKHPDSTNDMYLLVRLIQHLFESFIEHY